MLLVLAAGMPGISRGMAAPISHRPSDTDTPSPAFPIPFRAIIAAAETTPTLTPTFTPEPSCTPAISAPVIIADTPTTTVFTNQIFTLSFSSECYPTGERCWVGCDPFVSFEYDESILELVGGESIYGHTIPLDLIFKVFATAPETTTHVTVRSNLSPYFSFATTEIHIVSSGPPTPSPSPTASVTATATPTPSPTPTETPTPEPTLSPTCTYAYTSPVIIADTPTTSVLPGQLVTLRFWERCQLSDNVCWLGCWPYSVLEYDESALELISPLFISVLPVNLTFKARAAAAGTTTYVTVRNEPNSFTGIATSQVYIASETPTPTPSPTPSPTASPIPTETPTPTPSPSPTATSTPSLTPTASPSPTETATAEPTPSPTDDPGLVIETVFHTLLGSDPPTAQADYNGDGVVDAADLIRALLAK